MKVLLIPFRFRNSIKISSGEVHSLDSLFPYYVPSCKMFSSDYKSLHVNILQAFLKMSGKQDANQYLHLISDDFFNQFEKIVLESGGSHGHMRIAPFQYHFYQNGADIWTLGKHYQYRNRESPLLVSRIPKAIKPYRIIKYFYHDDLLSIYDYGYPFIYIFHKKTKQCQIIHTPYRENTVYHVKNNLLHIDFNEFKSTMYKKMTVSPNGKVLLGGMKKHWDTDYSSIYTYGLEQVLFWEDDDTLGDLILHRRVYMRILSFEVLKYQNRPILFCKLHFKHMTLHKEKVLFRVHMYAELPSDWNKLSFNMENFFEQLWGNHILPQNKKEINKWIKTATSEKIPPLGFFEYNV